MRIVTAVDSNYFDFLLQQVVACKGHLGILPDVYDLGLEDGQRQFLELAGMKVYPCPEHPEPGGHYPEGYKPKRETKAMIPLPYLEKDLPALAVYLAI